MKKLFFLLPAIFIALSSCTEKGEGEAPRPNILLIVTDDVTFDHWSAYADDFPTPHIENLAKEGMLFHQAYTTAAACTPSRFSIMTGQYPGRCIDPAFLSKNPAEAPYVIGWNTPITEENLTLHEVMKQAGYQTGYVGKFHIGDPGFDRPGANPDIPEIDPDLSPDSGQADSLLRIYQQVIAARVKALTGADYAGAIQWANPETLPLKAIRRHNLEYQVWGVRNFFSTLTGDSPFFLTLNATALHGPNHFEDLQTSPAYTAEGRIDALRHIMPSRSSIFERLHDLGIDYGEGVADHINHYLTGMIYMDDQLGAVMRMLREYGLDKNTLVIYTADHNIEPGKSTIYNRGVHVPFIAWWPDHIKPGTESYDHVQFIDLLPTFAELGGVEPDARFPIDGSSITGVFKGPQLIDDRVLYFEEGYTRGIMNGKYKYIAMRFPPKVLDALKSGAAGTINHLGTRRAAHASIAMEYYPGYFDADQLYDLEKDPYEQNNLAGDPAYADELAEMQRKLAGILSGFTHPFDLEANAFATETYYRNAAKASLAEGTDWIPWWNRKLQYPPE